MEIEVESLRMNVKGSYVNGEISDSDEIIGQGQLARIRGKLTKSNSNI